MDFSAPASVFSSTRSFYLAAIVCQVCFANLSLSDPTEEESPLTEKLYAFNHEILSTSRKLIVDPLLRC